MCVYGQAVKTTLFVPPESLTVASLQRKLLLEFVAEPFLSLALWSSPLCSLLQLWPAADPEPSFAIGLKCHLTCFPSSELAVRDN